MSIAFTHSARPTIGVELELHFVDADTGDLVSASNELLAEMSQGFPGKRPPEGATRTLPEHRQDHHRSMRHPNSGPR